MEAKWSHSAAILRRQPSVGSGKSVRLMRYHWVDPLVKGEYPTAIDTTVFVRLIDSPPYMVGPAKLRRNA